MIRSSLSLLVLAGALACAENATPTAPPSATGSTVSLSKSRDDMGKHVAVCKLQKEEWKSAAIGSKGGTVKVGASEITVPAGALSQTVTITAHMLPVTSASVQYSPEGLHFLKPATLKLNYSKCQTPLLGVNVVYVQADTVTEIEPSYNHPLFRYVTARLQHFSSYAIAY